MSKWDKDYIKLCKTILEEGTEVINRTGINTIKIPSYHLQFNLQEEFPCLTTKQLYFRQAILEMLWIYQAQSNDVRWLQKRNVHIWDEWVIEEDGYWRANQNVLEDGKVVNKDVEKFFGKKYAHTIGTAYGYIVKHYHLMDKLIDTLRENPYDRRLVISLWQDKFLNTAVLPSCVWSTEWDVSNGYLNMWVHQRSCDVPLGLPFNVTQYAVLLSLVAQVTNLKPGTINYSIKDAHIYVNQVDGIKQQIARFEKDGDYEAPTLWINPEIKEFKKFDNSTDLKDIKVLNYKHMGPIKFPLAK